MKRRLVICALCALIIGAALAAAAPARADELADAKSAFARQYEVAQVAWFRMAGASLCVSGARVMARDWETPAEAEADLEVWKAATAEMQLLREQFRTRADRLIDLIKRPGRRSIAQWRKTAEWLESRNPASENTEADARDVLRLLRARYGARPRLAHPMRTMRTLDREWFARHHRHDFEPVTL
jgi:hypothetical protein